MANKRSSGRSDRGPLFPQQATFEHRHKRKAPPRFPAARSTANGIGRLAESLVLAAETAKTPGEVVAGLKPVQVEPATTGKKDTGTTYR